MTSGWKWPLRRHFAPSSANDLSGVTELDLIDVTLLPAGGGPPEIPHLGLGFGGRGITVRRREGTVVALIPWASVVHLSIESAAAKGLQLSTDVRVEVESTRARHRFVVPNVQPEALRRSFRALSARYARDEHVLAGGTRR